MIHIYINVCVHIYIYICNYLKQLLYLNTHSVQNCRLTAPLAVFTQLIRVAKTVAAKGSPWGPALA